MRNWIKHFEWVCLVTFQGKNNTTILEVFYLINQKNTDFYENFVGGDVLGNKRTILLIGIYNINEDIDRCIRYFDQIPQFSKENLLMWMIALGEKLTGYMLDQVLGKKQCINSHKC